MMWMNVRLLVASVAVLLLVLPGCAKKVAPTTAAVSVEKEPRVEEVEAEELPMIEEEPITRQQSMAELRTIHFDFDQAAIRDDAREILEENARWFKANPGASVRIEGSCDERGTTEYNLALGQRRAEATKRFLMAMGVESSRLSTISYGEERPVCRDSHEGCWQKNRRSDFSVESR